MKAETYEFYQRHARKGKDWAKAKVEVNNEKYYQNFGRWGKYLEEWDEVDE